MNLNDKISRFLAEGYYAEGVRLLGECPGVPLSRLARFQAYLGRHFVPTAIEQELAGVLMEFVVAHTTERVPFGDDKKKVPFGDEKGTPTSPMGDQVAIKGAVSGTFWGALFAGKDAVPSSIWELYRQALELHKRQAHLHPLMCEAARRGEKHEARALAAEIMDDIVPALDGIYDLARQWGEDGKMPEESQRADVVKETVEKMRRIEYCKQRVSRIRGWLKAGERQVKGPDGKQTMRLTAQDIQALEKEMLERQVEEKGLREELGLDE